MTIRLRPLIAVLGGLVGVVITAPGVIGCIAAALQPEAAAQEPGGVGFCLVQSVIGSWLTYRWLTIRGAADAHEFHLRGWVKTLAVPTCHVAEVRCVESQAIDDWGSHEVLVDHRGESLGAIPSTLGICTEWTQFLAHLCRLAAASRARGPAAAEPPALEDIPVSEWTSEDIARYERRG